MKKLFLIALLFAGFTAQAQFADEKPLSAINNEFIQIWITQSKSGSKVYVDYGQERKRLYGEHNLMDEFGKDIKTLSHVPLINQMIGLGYEVMHITSLRDDNVNTLTLFFSKKIVFASTEINKKTRMNIIRVFKFSILFLFFESNHFPVSERH